MPRYVAASARWAAWVKIWERLHDEFNVGKQESYLPWVDEIKGESDPIG